MLLVLEVLLVCPPAVMQDVDNDELDALEKELSVGMVTEGDAELESELLELEKEIFSMHPGNDGMTDSPDAELQPVESQVTPIENTRVSVKELVTCQ